MVLPHTAGIYLSGDIHLSDEYSEYQWVPIAELENFEPKIENIPQLVAWAIKKLSEPDAELVTL